MTTYRSPQLIFFFILSIATALLCFLVFKPFIPTLAVAAIFAVVLLPLHERLATTFGNRRGLAALVLTLVIVLFTVSLLSFLAANIYQESKDFYLSVQSGQATSFEETAGVIEDKINSFLPNFKIDVRAITEKVFAWASNHLAPLASSTANIFFKILLATVTMFFLLRDSTHLRKAIVTLSPLKDQHDDEILSRLSVTINSVVRGSLLIATIQGTLVGLGFFLFGVPEAFLWGTVAAVTALIPGVGTALVLTPGILFLFLTGHTGTALGLLVWSVIIVGMVDNFLAPYLYGRGSRVHPLLMLLSVIGGISVFGIAGFIFGPVLVSLAFTLADIYRLVVPKQVEE